ncbi:MAG: hypothetical protein WCR72_01360, partial [Bacteroidota bacterium]
MKRLLLFLFTVAFLSMLSTSAFAQWGRTVAVSSNTELQKAAQDPTIEKVVLSEGYYDGFSRKVNTGEVIIFSKPGTGGSVRAPGTTCYTGTAEAQSVCYSVGATVEIEAWQTGTSCPAIIGWVANGTNASFPATITPHVYSVGDPNWMYKATISNFESGKSYSFKYKWVGTTAAITNTFYIWNHPVVSTFSNQDICISELATTPVSSYVTWAYDAHQDPYLAPINPSYTHTYSWTGTGAGDLNSTTSAAPVFKPGTPAGTYTLTLQVTEDVAVDNDNGFQAHACQSSTVTKTVVIHNLPSISTSHTNVSCNGGADGTATVTSPTGVGVSYSWNTSPVQTSNPATGLSAGTYIVTVTDVLTCTNTASVTITQPDILSATVNKTNVTCYNAANGTITVSLPLGGYGTYEYRLDAGAWQTSGSFTSLAPNTYSVQIRDAANTGCTITLGPQTITQPDILSATVNKTNVT